MRSIPIIISLKLSITKFALQVLIGLMLLGCSSTKKMEQKTNLINQKPELTSPILSNSKDSLTQIVTSKEENEIVPPAILTEEFINSNIPDIKTPVANKIVENYLYSENKESSGHCLSVSKGRLEQAYKEVHGHLIYEDLPDSMASKRYTSKQVFNMLYDSASDTYQGWRSLPEKYRGKGSAGAIAYAGMGTLVDSTGIWSGQLKPGALMQVWRDKEDYEKVVRGVNVKKLDSFGHSFIFISYMFNEKNEITGLKIADQGFQGNAPMMRRTYEVWWAVNLSI